MYVLSFWRRGASHSHKAKNSNSQKLRDERFELFGGVVLSPSTVITARKASISQKLWDVHFELLALWCPQSLNAIAQQNQQKTENKIKRQKL